MSFECVGEDYQFWTGSGKGGERTGTNSHNELNMSERMLCGVAWSYWFRDFVNWGWTPRKEGGRGGWVLTKGKSYQQIVIRCNKDRIKKKNKKGVCGFEHCLQLSRIWLVGARNQYVLRVIQSTRQHHFVLMIKPLFFQFPIRTIKTGEM